jgi:hypothetical protein
MALPLEAAGRRRSPSTMPGTTAGRPPRNKGSRYPADPPTVDEIVAVMRHASDDRHVSRLRAMIVVLWRAGYASTTRSRSQNTTSPGGAARSWCAGARAAAGARSAWTTGAGSSCAPGSLPGPRCRRAVVLRDRRGNPRQGLSAAASAPSCVASPVVPESGAGSRRTDCATRTGSSSAALT